MTERTVDEEARAISAAATRVNSESRQDIYNSVVRQKQRNMQGRRLNTNTDEPTVEEDDTIEDMMDGEHQPQDDLLA